MDNKARNEKILNLTCEMLGKINYEVENAFVEDIPGEAEENQVLVSVTVPQPGGLIRLRSKHVGTTTSVVVGG